MYCLLWLRNSMDICYQWIQNSMNPKFNGPFLIRPFLIERNCVYDNNHILLEVSNSWLEDPRSSAWSGAKGHNLPTFWRFKIGTKTSKTPKKNRDIVITFVKSLNTCIQHCEREKYLNFLQFLYLHTYTGKSRFPWSMYHFTKITNLAM